MYIQCTVQYGVHFSCGKTALSVNKSHRKKLFSLCLLFHKLPFLLFSDNSSSKVTHTTESFSSLSPLSLLRTPLFRQHTVTLKVTNTTESFSLSFSPSVSTFLSSLNLSSLTAVQSKVTHMTKSFFSSFLHSLFYVPSQSFGNKNIEGTTATA
jgi:hypothetical protein